MLHSGITDVCKYPTHLWHLKSCKKKGWKSLENPQSEGWGARDMWRGWGASFRGRNGVVTHQSRGGI
eukprot:750657-Hanusia_phi.AAC.1